MVRNAIGEVLGALSKKISLPTLVELLETLAARRAAFFVVDLGLHDFIFEGYLEVVMQALLWGVSPLSSIGYYRKTYCLFQAHLNLILSLM